MSFRRAEIVDRPDDQLFSGSGLARDEHRGIGLRHLAHAREDVEDRRGLADDVAERGLGADLLLEVDVLLLEARLQRGDLLVGEQVLDRESHLLGDREEQRGVVGPVGTAHAASDVQGSDDLSFDGHRNRDGGAKTSLEQSGVLEERRRIPHVERDERHAVIEHPSIATLLTRQFGADRKDRRQGHGPGHTEHPEDLLDGIVDVERRAVEWDHVFQRLRGRVLPSHRNPAGPAHPRGIHHNGVKTHDRLDSVRTGQVGNGLHHRNRTDGIDPVDLLPAVDNLL